MSRYPKGFVGDDERLRKTDGQNREDRESADNDRTQKDGTALTAEERRRLLRQEFTQEVLPSVPQIPGYHICWLTTQTKGDSISSRVRLGYTPVKVSEIPGYEQYSFKGGEWEGAISCNEMVLFKIPLEVYNDLMTIYHHDMPNEHEESIKTNIAARGLEIEAEKGIPDGFNSGAVRTPTFI